MCCSQCLTPCHFKEYWNSHLARVKTWFFWMQSSAEFNYCLHYFGGRQYTIDPFLQKREITELCWSGSVWSGQCYRNSHRIFVNTEFFEKSSESQTSMKKFSLCVSLLNFLYCACANMFIYWFIPMQKLEETCCEYYSLATINFFFRFSS